MFKLDNIIRENIKRLKPYSSARHEFTGEASIFLDANENSLGSPLLKSYERYPDPHQRKLRQQIAEMKGIETESLFLGNGSDECIDLIYRCFCEPGRDNVIVSNPTYGMYEVYAAINNVEVRDVPLNSAFELNAGAIVDSIDDKTTVIWICSPNNPTGNSTPLEVIKELSKKFKGLVVVDEAYVDFSNGGSAISLLADHPNIVVLQTFSKAWGLAGLRLGMAVASKEVICLLQKVKPPYNVGQETQDLAIQSLRQKEKKDQKVQELILLREDLRLELEKIPGVKKVYRSEANFLLVEFDNATTNYQRLLQNGIVTRNRSAVPALRNCLRITVGSPVENAALLSALGGRSARSAIHSRKTNETNISVQLNVEGTGRSSISTGLNFFDHMLEQIARHGLIDLVIRADGDLEVDEHHTVEDTAISLGEAFAKAIGNKRGMERYGFALPMDDAEAKVLIDFGGRSWIVWDVQFSREKIGDVPAEMFFHFFKSFSDTANCNLNVQAKGENEHHKIEAIFKAFAKAIKMAVKRDPLSDHLPTTKGVL